MSTDNNPPASNNTPPAPANGIQRIPARPAEVGGIPIHRLLPFRLRRTIGAWCFLDHAGPSTFAPGHGMRVGPHPHIGLQTFTWMLKGEVLHRDSLGNVQIIRPGQVNLMTAGRGISHTEECLPQETTLHTAQLWIALPPEAADCEPAFHHHPVMPTWQQAGCTVTLLAGTTQGHTAPTRVYTPLLGMDITSALGGELVLPVDPDFEHGLLALEGAIIVNDESFAIHELAYLAPGQNELRLRLSPGCRVIVLGGTPNEHETLIWWNFVGHSKEAIAQAQHDWEAGSERFGQVTGFDGPALMPPPLPWPGY